MSLFKPTGDITLPQKMNVETVTYDQRTSTVFENLESPVNVSATLDGSPWKVLLLNQVLGVDDIPRQLDLGLDPSLQQYIAVKNYIIGVTSPLSHSKDTDTGITTVSGGAQAYPSVQLNVGDMFVAMQIDQRLGLFRITDVTRLQYIAGSAFEIEYRLHDYYNPQYEENINRKIIKTYLFDESKVACGKAIVDASHARDIGLTLKELSNWYYDMFYDLASETFLWPYNPDDSVTRLVYDHFAVCFFRALLDYDLRGLNPEARVYSCLNGTYRDNSITIWDTMMTTNTRSLSLVKQKSLVVSPDCFETDRMYNSITASPINYVMWPSGLQTLTGSSDINAGTPYVFTEAFYSTDSANMSLMEKTVHNLLHGVTVDNDNIDTLITELSDMSEHSLYHAIPVMIWILKAHTR